MKYLLILSAIFVYSSQAQVIYPLQIGNRWRYVQYEGGWPDSVEFEITIIGDTTFPNGKTYAIRKWVYSNFIRQDYQRVGSEGVYAYNTADSTECVLYQFNLQPGDTGCENTYAGQHIASIFGKQLNAYLFWSFMPGFGEEVVDSFGVAIYYGEIAVRDVLVGAVINGFSFGVINAVSDDKRNQPKTFHLSQNYPNPFNPSTSISFSVKNAGWVNLSVFDLLGRRVAVLVDEVKSPGVYVASWRPESISSGVYFYQLRSDFDFSTKLLIYAK